VYVFQIDGSLFLRVRAPKIAGFFLNIYRPVPFSAQLDAAIRERFNILLPENFV
jgi:hypothetical protein